MSGQELPDWVMDFVLEVIQFEEDHPKLYEAGETVTYHKPVEGGMVPQFVDARGTLVGRVWCMDLAQRLIPDDIKQAAHWYQRGRERGTLDE